MDSRSKCLQAPHQIWYLFHNKVNLVCQFYYCQSSDNNFCATHCFVSHKNRKQNERTAVAAAKLAMYSEAYFTDYILLWELPFSQIG